MPVDMSVRLAMAVAGRETRDTDDTPDITDMGRDCLRLRRAISMSVLSCSSEAGPILRLRCGSRLRMMLTMSRSSNLPNPVL